MNRSQLSLIAFGLFAFANLPVILGAPSQTTPSKADASKSNEEDDDAAFGNPYYVQTLTYKKFGKCQEVSLVIGPNFDDKFSAPCSKNGLITLQPSKEKVIVGNPETDPLSLYSDKPEEIVVIRNKECVRRTYLAEGDKESEDSEVEFSECKNIKEEMADEQEKSWKLWVEWQKKMEDMKKWHVEPVVDVW